jgi:DnaJ-class molecular chaperone
MTDGHTHYDNLFVAQNAPIEVIRAAYRALAQKYHPDKNIAADAERIMKIVNEAWAILSDAELRREHDNTIYQRTPTKHSPESAAKKDTEKQSQSESPKTQQDNTSRTTASQPSLIASLRPLAAKLWFENFGRQYILDYLKSHGLESKNATKIVDEIFSN